MKTILFKACALCTLLATAASCNDDMEFTDTNASPVTEYYEPANGKAVKLVPSATASLLFEWSAAHAESGAVPQYEVVFATADGDLNHPIYRVTSDNIGSSPMASISHKTLTKIMTAAGVDGGERGIIKWGVISYAGVNGTLSPIEHTLDITRYVGFAETPNSLYITGAGTEAGDDVTNAMVLNKIDSDVYEMFTKLTAGQKIYFTADKDGSETYSMNGTRLVEGEDGGSGVDATGVYRMTVDFSTASVTLKQIESLHYIMDSDSPKLDYEMDYVGNGVYQMEKAIETKDTGWSWDPFESRYKFKMIYTDGSVSWWGPSNSGEDNKPNTVELGNSYFSMSEYDNNNPKWKLPDVWYKKDCIYSVYFNTEHGGYTHFAVEK